MSGLRITGGEWRGRRLRTPRGDATRPSSDQFRESVMQILGDRLPGARVLDLFGGSGALAFESLSPGAASAAVVELARAAVDVIRRNAEELGLGRDTLQVLRGDAYRVRPPGPFDVVFVAPPYPLFRSEGHRIRRLVADLAAVLAPGGVVVVQAGLGDFHGAGLPGLVVDDERTYGRTTFWFLTLAA